MPTGSASANVQNKSLLGYQDVADRILLYLKLSHEDATQARFDLDGACSAILTGTPSVADSLVFATGKATDGIGHIIDFSQLTLAERTLKFTNAAAITYYFAAAYAQEARGLRVSPHTGAPQYVSWIDTIGERGAPNTVTDNGNGTITLVINSITQSAVDHSGKKVVVWLVNPLSATESVAIEVLTSTFSGGNNRVTTTGALGQSAISTNPADYVVLARGVSFRTNPFPSGFFNLGTVLGNGPAVVPNALNTSTQRLLKTFQDASQIVFTPYSYISSVNIQAAVQELIDDLQSHSSATAGGIRIGNNPGDYSPKLTAANYSGVSPVGGLGTVFDGTFASTSERHVDRSLQEIDRVLRSRRTAITFGTIQDSDDTSGTAALGNRTYHIRPSATPYYASTQGVGSRVFGEQGSSDNSGANQRIDLLGPGGGLATLTGSYERCLLTIPDPASNQEVWATPSFWLKHCGMEWGPWTFGPGGAEAFRVVSDCLFQDHPGLSTHTGAYGIRFRTVASGGRQQMIFERTVFKGGVAPNRTHSDLYFDGAWGDDAALKAPTVFRDCVFTQGKDALPILSNGPMTVPWEFENCIFLSTPNHTVPLVDSTSGSFRFRGCFFYAENGDAIRMLKCRRSLLADCRIRTGDSIGSNPIAQPQIVNLSGPGSVEPEGFEVRNLNVHIGRKCIVTSGSDVKNLVLIGRSDTGSNPGTVEVDGLYAYYSDAAAALGTHHSASIFVDAYTIGVTDQGWKVSNVILDVNGACIKSADTFSPSGRGVLSIWGNPSCSPIRASNVQIRGAQNTPSGLGTIGKRWLELCFNVSLNGGSIGTFDQNQGSFSTTTTLLYAEENVKVTDLDITVKSGEGTSTQYVYNLVGDNCQIIGGRVRIDSTSGALLNTPKMLYAPITSDYHDFKNVKFQVGYVEPSGSASLFDIAGDDCCLAGNTFHAVAWGTPATSKIFGVAGNRHQILGNRGRYGVAGATTWLAISANNSIAKDNIFRGASVLSNTGSGNITSDNLVGL